MAEAQSTDERLKDFPSFPHLGFHFESFVNDDGRQVLVIQEGDDGDLRLFINEARALRDWLNQVLP